MRANNATERLALLQQVGALMAGGRSAADAAREVGLSPATLSRWQAAYRAGGLTALAPGKSTGRRPLAELLSAKAIQELRQNYLKTKSVRLCFDVFATSPECPEELREQLLAKRDLPPSLMRLVTVNPQVRAVHQGDRHLQLNGAVNLRDMTELMPDSTRRPIQPGDWWEFDDMSLNQPFWFDADPEDHPGDPLVAKHGKSLGRQSLWSIDVASGKWLGYELIGRRRDAYRAEDILRFMRRLFQTHGLPRRGVRLERGIWKSRRVRGVEITAHQRAALGDGEAMLTADYDLPDMGEEEQAVVVGGLQQLGLEVVYCWSPRQKGIIEGGFDHLQDIINLVGNK